MNSRDWDFAIGSLGDPLADISDWMIPPYPKCIDPKTHEQLLKEETDGTD